MKKIVLWLMSTVTALVLLFGYHTSTSSSVAAGQGGDASVAVPATTGTSGGASSSSASSSSSSSASGSTNSTGNSSATTTVTGTPASPRYGPVQVRLTIAKGKNPAGDGPEFPENNGKDEQINGRALPIPGSETPKAQSAAIDMVSGATYTSDGYL